MITRPNKQICLGSLGRGVTGSTADFGHRRESVVAARCGFNSLRPYSRWRVAQR